MFASAASKSSMSTDSSKSIEIPLILDLAVKALRTGRAPGLVEVTAELLKLPKLREELLKVLNAVYVSGTVPEKMALERLDPHSQEWGFAYVNQLQGNSPHVHPCNIK